MNPSPRSLRVLAVSSYDVTTFPDNRHVNIVKFGLKLKFWSEYLSAARRTLVRLRTQLRILRFGA
jgi:hypothetical protein